MISRFLIIAVFNSSTVELLSSASLICIDCFCISDSIVSRNSGSETFRIHVVMPCVNRCYGLMESPRFPLSIRYPPLKLIHVYKAYYWGNSAYYSGYHIGLVPWEP